MSFLTAPDHAIGHDGKRLRVVLRSDIFGDGRLFSGAKFFWNNNLVWSNTSTWAS